MSQFLLLTTLLAEASHTPNVVGNKTIRTSSGRVSVSIEEYDVHMNGTMKKIMVGMKIPYAAPPIGELRFKPPHKHSHWNDTLICDRSRIKVMPACYQSKGWDHWDKNDPDVNAFWTEYTGGGGGIMATESSEDCLYLNVWSTSMDIGFPHSKRRPVIFFIHGGQFQFDTAFNNLYEATAMALTNDVVVVTFNYRHGPLGFAAFNHHDKDMHVEKHHVSGNAGLMDIAKALEWVHENIEAFGGDKNRVTLYGAGAGAAAVQHLMSSDMVPSDYYSGTILSSGVLGSHNSYKKPDMAVKTTMNLAKRLGCHHDDHHDDHHDNVHHDNHKPTEAFNHDDHKPTEASSTHSMAECMQKADVHEIVRHAKHMLNEDHLGHSFLPTTDDKFFTHTPEKALHSLSQTMDKPMLIGFNHDEGSFEVAEHDLVYRMRSKMERLSKSEFDAGVKLIVPEAKDADVLETIRDEYFHMMTRDLIDFITDYWYKCDTLHVAEKLHRESPSGRKQGVRIYRFDAGFRFADKAYHYFGAGHGLELFPVWARPYMAGVNETLYKENEGDQMLSYFMMKTWSDFAKGHTHLVPSTGPNELFVMDKKGFIQGKPEYPRWDDDKCHFIECIPDFGTWFKDETMKDSTCKRYVDKPTPPPTAGGSTAFSIPCILMASLLAAATWLTK